MNIIITHFDGDPFLLNFWLTLYEKYWRGEADRIYLSLFYNPKVIPAPVIDYDLKRLDAFKEIEVFQQPRWEIPEFSNQLLYSKAKADKVGFVESDGFIFGPGFVKRNFDLLDKYDIVAPQYDLIKYPFVRGDLGVMGFMRCFFFAKKSLLDKVEMDFMPKDFPVNSKLPIFEQPTTERINLDCFGWVSMQLATLHPKILYIPANVSHSDTIEKSNQYEGNQYIHVRQMMSSALGLGGGEYGFWTNSANEAILEKVFTLFNEHLPDGPAEFIYMKAVAFRLLFYEMLFDKSVLGTFADDYLRVLEMVIDWYAMPKEKIYELKGFFKGIMKI